MLRRAKIKDVRTIHKILQDFGSRGELLPRPLAVLYEGVRDFSVYEDPSSGEVVGCCSLQVCWEDLGEIRSLAVRESHWGRGIGSQLTRWALDEGREIELRQVFTLTYRPGFFERFGFSRIEHARLPLKIWGDCMACVKFPDCDEIAMIRELD